MEKAWEEGLVTAILFLQLQQELTNLRIPPADESWLPPLTNRPREEHPISSQVIPVIRQAGPILTQYTEEDPSPSLFHQ